MKIDVITYHESIYDRQISESTVVVIDVLRCTSAMINAFVNGCTRIIPVVEAGDAIMLAKGIGRKDCVVGGERGCNIVPGFDVGNSPFEYSRERVKGRTVIVSTSNGTNAICGVSQAKRVYSGALNNSRACAKRAASSENDVLIVCSGTNGMISADDCIAAGSIIRRMLDSGVDCSLSDVALICVNLYDSWKKGGFDLHKTYHCARLISLGYEKDVDYCLKEDTTELVPVFENGVCYQPIMFHVKHSNERS